MNTAYLLTGSNMGNREEILEKARLLIAEHCGELIAVSSLYETAAWGNTDQPAFLNQAIQLNTDKTARQLIRRLLKIEKMLGRVRMEKYGPRLIDIDILLFNDEVHNYDLLRIPHPELPNRRFALMPLAEIAGTLIHPVIQIPVQSLLDQCSDPLDVKRLS